MSEETLASRLAQPLRPPPVDSRPASREVPRRGPLLVVALLSAIGGAAIYLAALPALWRMSWPYGLLFAALGAAQVGSAVGAWLRPARRRLAAAASAALAVVTLWGLVHSGVLPGPNPWTPVDSVVGFTDTVCAMLQIIAVAGLGAVAAFATGGHRSPMRRVVAAVAVTPLALLVLAGSLVGVAAASDGLAGAGFPAGAVPPRDLPAGARSTVEYCRPDGVPLAMDVYQPPAAARDGRPAPVAMYVHGGGAVLGDRKIAGLGAQLANHEGALFGPLQRALNARGFVVTSIDYRLLPAVGWPGPIEDAKCAVRFLRAHAAGLGIDPDRIGVWGSSAGGQLCSLLGLAGPAAGFDRGQYPGQSSAVDAVVDMFGPGDLTDLSGVDPFGHFITWIGYGGSTAVRRSASPDGYVGADGPPFLILFGTEDHGMPRQSRGLAERLRAAGVPTTLVAVQAAGHGLADPGQRPSPAQLTERVVAFLTATLR
jgi:acetyl esterase/lipase